MPRPKKHVFVCAQSRPAGHPRGSCGEKNGAAVLDAMMNGVFGRELPGVLVTATGCMGPCSEGPTIVVYPEGIMYNGVKVEDVEKIIEQHLIGDQPVEELFASEEVWS